YFGPAIRHTCLHMDSRQGQIASKRTFVICLRRPYHQPGDAGKFLIFVARQPQRSKTELTNCLDDHRRGSLCERPQQALSISAFCPAPDVFPLNQLCEYRRWGGWLPTGTAAVSKAAEYHLCKNIRRYVTTTPFSIELFRWRCGLCFVYCLSRRNQIHDALANLHQHVTVFF